MRRFLLLGWVLVGLVLGAVLHLAGRPDWAAYAWSAAGAPVAVHVAIGLVRSLLGGRLGVDVVALAAIVGAILLGEAAAAAVIGLMVAGGEALEAWAEGRASQALRDLVARAPRRPHRGRHHHRDRGLRHPSRRPAAHPPRRDRRRRRRAGG